MAEMQGPSGVGSSGSGTSGHGSESTMWQTELRSTMQASDDLFSQYRKTEKVVFLDGAISLAESAILEMTPPHPDLVIWLAMLRRMMGCQFGHTKDQVDLDMAWVWAMEEMDNIPERAISWATACSSILTIRRQLESEHDPSSIPRVEFLRIDERPSKSTDLNERITRIKRVVEKCLLDNLDQVDMLHSWGITLRKIFERVDDKRNLESAIGIMEEIVRGAYSGDQNYNALETLARIFYEKFGKAGGGPGDLQKAIEYNEAALAAIQNDHPTERPFKKTRAKVFPQGSGG